MSITRYLGVGALLLSLASLTNAHGAATAEPITIDTVWAGHPVGFALLTHDPMQFVAYYDGDRNMVVASRLLDGTEWTRVVLPETVGWDSHNYITLAMDDKECLHLSGNMHVNPLVYFKMARPLDIESMTRVERLVGKEESRMTYPRFFRGPANEFIYTYRDGSSGSGNQIYDVYDADTDTWSRLLDQPLTDGHGAMNAYLDGPRLGPDGRYHVVWVWRDTSDCATNHHASYMRSPDLRHWETAAGEPLTLPVTIDSTGTIVDPVPPGGGLINGNIRLGFDAEKRPVVSYHKYDGDGNSQVYNARWNNTGWAISQASDWNDRWDFQGGGSIEFKVRVGAVHANADGTLEQTWSHWNLGSERWLLDATTLRATEKLPKKPSDRPEGFNQPTSDFSGIRVRTAPDLGPSPDKGTRYLLRWETLGPNRDKPQTLPVPPPGELKLYQLAR